MAKWCHHETVAILTHRIGRFAMHPDLGATQGRLPLVERGFDLPTLVVESRQLGAFGGSRRVGTSRQIRSASATPFSR
jgi:hypothetical protein